MKKIISVLLIFSMIVPIYATTNNQRTISSNNIGVFLLTAQKVKRLPS